MNVSHTARHAVAALAVASTFASGAALAGPANAPFKATLVTQEALSPDISACQAFPFLAGTTVGTGHASHLGAVTGTGTDCFNPTMTGQYFFSNGKLTMITMNGDELRADYGGTLTPTGTAQIYTISGTYRITSGTGRFAMATGSGTLLGVENIKTLQGQLNFAGTISY